MIRAGIIGATGYAGVEIIKELLSHPEAKISALSSVSFEGKRLSEIYPNFHGVFDPVLEGEDQVIEKSDVVFAALPGGLSVPLARKILSAGKIYIDIGGDLRIRDAAARKAYYGLEDGDEIVAMAEYGLPEIFRSSIPGKKVIANPGCYPTCAALGLYPALKNGLIGLSPVVIDAKSGVTGAGRSLSLATHFTECNEALGPYKIGSHRHAPEIAQTLSAVAGEKVPVTFVPHLVPLNRGILSTIYVDKTDGASFGDLETAYKECYGGEPFVDVLPAGQTANLKYVKFTNRCQISLHEDLYSGKVIIVSVIDNMGKGAAGQAVQNMNLLFGLPEDTGLSKIAPAF